MSEANLSTQIDGHVTSDDVMEELLRGDANERSSAAQAAAGTPAPAASTTEAAPAEEVPDNTPIDPRDENPYFAQRRSTTAQPATPAQPATAAATDNAATASTNSTSDRATNTSNQPEQNAGTGSVFDLADSANTSSTPATPATAGSEASQAVALKDTDLVDVNGELVPWGKVKGATIFKPEYDKQLNKLNADREDLLKREAVVKSAAPHIQALMNDPAGRAYADVLLSTQDPARALAAAAAARGVVLPEAAAPKPDPRLVPPKDANGEALDTSDPRYVEWLAGDRTDALVEQTANRVKSEIQADADRKAQAERTAREESERQRQVTTTAEQAHWNRNVASINTIGDAFRARGVDPSTLSPEDWTRAKNMVAETGKAAGKDVRSDEWLRANVIEPGDVQLMVDASGVVDKIKSGLAKRSATEAAKGAAAAKGPEKIPDVQTDAETERARELADQQQRGRIANYYNPRQPLNAGSNSEMIPGRQTGYQAPRSPADMLREADRELGIDA